ncbi:MFS transporter, partial [Pokkaliibacter plantistimulans]
GSYLGAIVGWRGAFFVLVPIAMVTLVWQWISLPPMQGKRPSASSGNVFSVLKSRAVVFGMAGCGAFFMGQFMLFTYLRPFLERVTLVSVPTLSLLLMGIGVMGVVGTIAIGPLLKRSLFAPLISIPVLMSVMALALIPLGANLGYVTILLGLWGFFATAAPVGWWSWVARTMPDNAEA